MSCHVIILETQKQKNNQRNKFIEHKQKWMKTSKVLLFWQKHLQWQFRWTNKIFYNFVKIIKLWRNPKTTLRSHSKSAPRNWNRSFNALFVWTPSTMPMSLGADMCSAKGASLRASVATIAVLSATRSSRTLQPMLLRIIISMRSKRSSKRKRKSKPTNIWKKCSVPTRWVWKNRKTLKQLRCCCPSKRFVSFDSENNWTLWQCTSAVSQIPHQSLRKWETSGRNESAQRKSQCSWHWTDYQVNQHFGCRHSAESHCITRSVGKSDQCAHRVARKQSTQKCHSNSTAFDFRIFDSAHSVSLFRKQCANERRCATNHHSERRTQTTFVAHRNSEWRHCVHRRRRSFRRKSVLFHFRFPKRQILQFLCLRRMQCEMDLRELFSALSQWTQMQTADCGTSTWLGDLLLRHQMWLPISQQNVKDKRVKLSAQRVFTEKQFLCSFWFISSKRKLL